MKKYGGYRRLLPLLVLLVISMTMLTACDEAPGGPAPAPGNAELGQTLVPNVPLDVYVYLQQDELTVVPFGTLDVPFEMGIVSLAIWGAASGDDFTFAAAFRFSGTAQASLAAAEIVAEDEVWYLQVDATLYIVNGSGPAATLLQTAISNNDFVNYNDNDGLAAAADLSPDSGDEKLVGIAIVKPTPAFIAFVAEGEDEDFMSTVDTMLAVTQLKVVAGGIYAREHLDLARITAGMDEGGDVLDTGVSIMGMVRSGLPGLIVSPTVAKILEEQEFALVEIDGEEYYELAVPTDTGKTVYFVVRLDGSKIFVAASGDKSRATGLASGVK